MPTATAVAGIAVFIATLALIVTRPRNLSEAFPAAVGGLAMLLLGVVTPRQVAQTLAANATLFLFFLGLMTIAAITEEAGFFERVAHLAARWAVGSPTRLLVNLFVAGAVITAFLSNDATALVLTPVVYVLVVRLRLEPTPYVFACTFVADASSFLLPVSNPVNVILLGSSVGLGTFLTRLLPAEVCVLTINLFMFLALFRGDLVGTVEPTRLGIDKPIEAYLRWILGVLACIAAGYVVAATVGAPVAYVAGAGAVTLLITAAAGRRLSPRKLAGAISWPLFPFIAGMLVVVRGVENLGLTALFGQLLVGLAGGTLIGASLVGTLGVALGANLINNVPMALVTQSSIAALPASSAAHQPLLFAAVLGADLGPNVSVAGSLATMLWLLILRRRGLEISSIQYLKLGLIITPPALVAGALAIWGSARLFP